MVEACSEWRARHWEGGCVPGLSITGEEWPQKYCWNSVHFMFIKGLRVGPPSRFHYFARCEIPSICKSLPSPVVRKGRQGRGPVPPNKHCQRRDLASCYPWGIAMKTSRKEMQQRKTHNPSTKERPLAFRGNQKPKGKLCLGWREGYCAPAVRSAVQFSGKLRHHHLGWTSNWPLICAAYRMGCEVATITPPRHAQEPHVNRTAPSDIISREDKPK